MVNTGKQMLLRAISSGRTVMTHVVVTGHNAVMTVPYSPLST
jgi:hypothetical protein